MGGEDLLITLMGRQFIVSLVGFGFQNGVDAFDDFFMTGILDGIITEHIREIFVFVVRGAGKPDMAANVLFLTDDFIHSRSSRDSPFPSFPASKPYPTDSPEKVRCE